MSKPINPTVINNPDRFDPEVDAMVSANVTLRDLFAAAALVGILAGRPTGQGIEHVARAPEAFRVADAMLAERAKA